jgi:hypothetical protein
MNAEYDAIWFTELVMLVWLCAYIVKVIIGTPEQRAERKARKQVAFMAHRKAQQRAVRRRIAARHALD